MGRCTTCSRWCVHGSEAQKRDLLPRLASGQTRLQAMGVTEPTTGTDTTKLKTTAVKKGDKYVINGQKVWISRVQHSDYMILLARTTPLSEVKKKSEGLSIFLVDLEKAIGNGMSVRPILNMVNHETNELFFDNLELPLDSLIGEEGKGFKYILDGLNAERTLIAAECIGDGRWFVEKARNYANERIVFDRPIGKNQGVQFPIAEAHIEVEAADLMRWRACQQYDAGEPAGASANMGQVPGRQGVVGSRECLPADAWRFRLCVRIRRRTEVPRDPPVSGRADLDQPDPGLRGRAPAGSSAFLLSIEAAHGPIPVPT